MELKTIDMSRIIHLTNLVRPKGQLYLPEAVAAVYSRYVFAKVPSVQELVGANQISFKLGKFDDVAIDDLTIYTDGLSASSRADTDKIWAFIEDFLSFVAREFEVTPVSTVVNHTFYDSQVVVQTERTLDGQLRKFEAVAAIIDKNLKSYGLDVLPFSPFGINLDLDGAKQVGRKPSRFAFERRLGITFEMNLYYSIAPLRTKDHLLLLNELEALL
jgi:hypothetical protein